jgi:carbonic anhydrase
MSCNPACSVDHGRHGRRAFLRIAGIATAAPIVAGNWQVAFAAALTKERRDKASPDQILAAMKKGNERFRHGKESPHNYLAQQKASAKGQYPAAVILSCIDSRAPAETIMSPAPRSCWSWVTPRAARSRARSTRCSSAT